MAALAIRGEELTPGREHEQAGTAR
jgi:hypothetical protein